MLVLLPSWAKADDGEWRKIKNSLYSIELPASWAPMQGMPGDGTKPGEREARGYHLHYFGWQSPVKGRDEIRTSMSIDIQTYQKMDKTPVVIRELAKILVTPHFKTQTELYSREGELCLSTVKDSKEMDGTMVQYRVFFLFRKVGAGVHCVRVSLRDDFFKEKPENEKIIKHILKSFKVIPHSLAD